MRIIDSNDLSSPAIIAILLLKFRREYKSAISGKMDELCMPNSNKPTFVQCLVLAFSDDDHCDLAARGWVRKAARPLYTVFLEAMREKVQHQHPECFYALRLLVTRVDPFALASASLSDSLADCNEA